MIAYPRYRTFLEGSSGSSRNPHLQADKILLSGLLGHLK
jgi:hypothetical protein